MLVRVFRFLILFLFSTAVFSENVNDSLINKVSEISTLADGKNIDSLATPGTKRQDSNFSTEEEITFEEDAPLPFVSATDSLDSNDVASETAVASESSQKADSVTVSVNDSSSTTIIEEITEEELILDGGEESIIVPSISTEASQLPTAQPDSQLITTTSSDSSTRTKDSLPTQQEVKPHYPPSPIQLPVEEETPELKIEKTRSINFAKNFKEYRSPKVAMLLSLFIPGAGQAYAKNYLKTGLYAVVEVALIGVGAFFYKEGKDLEKHAKTFADDNYDTTMFKNYYNNFSNYYKEDSTIIHDIFYADKQNLAEQFLINASGKSDTANKQDFYDYIKYSDYPYIQGWEDVNPRFDQNMELTYSDTLNKSYFQVNNDDSAYFVYEVNYQINTHGDTISQDTSKYFQYGFSNFQKEYNSILTDKNSEYKKAKVFFTLLLLNHIISAVDAGITAKAYNDKLLGKNSIWQRFNLRDTYVRTPSGSANGFALEVRF